MKRINVNILRFSHIAILLVLRTTWSVRTQQDPLNNNVNNNTSFTTSSTTSVGFSLSPLYRHRNRLLIILLHYPGEIHVFAKWVRLALNVLLDRGNKRTLEAKYACNNRQYGGWVGCYWGSLLYYKSNLDPASYPSGYTQPSVRSSENCVSANTITN